MHRDDLSSTIGNLYAKNRFCKFNLSYNGKDLIISNKLDGNNTDRKIRLKIPFDRNKQFSIEKLGSNEIISMENENVECLEPFYSNIVEPFYDGEEGDGKEGVVIKGEGDGKEGDGNAEEEEGEGEEEEEQATQTQASVEKKDKLCPSSSPAPCPEPTKTQLCPSGSPAPCPEPTKTRLCPSGSPAPCYGDIDSGLDEITFYLPTGVLENDDMHFKIHLRKIRKCRHSR